MTWHAICRAKERYGLNLTRYDLSRMVDDIQNKKTLLMSIDHQNGTEVHTVRWGDQFLVAIWKPQDQKIVTFCPEEKIHAHKHLASMRRPKGLKGPKSGRARREGKREAESFNPADLDEWGDG